MRITTLLILALFLACNTAQQPDQKEVPDTEGTPKEIEEEVIEQKPMINTTKPYYLHLEGTISDYPINMELMYFPNRYESSPGYQGYYYYQKYGEIIDLYGSEEEPGLISLSESDVQGNNTGNFQGRLNEQGHFEGRWISGDQKRTLPFELKPSDQSMLSFDLLLFSDSLLIEGFKTKKVPRIHVNQRWLYPKDSGDATLVRFLRSEIGKNIVGDSLAAIYTTPKAAFHVDKIGYFQEYKEDILSILEGEQENHDEIGWTVNYEIYRDMEIYFLSPTLLTFGVMDYYYTGGAHGNYSTAVHTYDLTKKKAIKLEDLFKPGYEETMSQILAAKARETYGIEPSQALSEFFFVDQIDPTENFGLTDKGIFFVYNPYEIAAYVYGEIKLFVAFEEVKEWVK